MSRSIATLGFALSILGFASSAVAGEWWLVHSGGVKPRRVSVAIEESSLRPLPFATNTYRVESMVVLEGAELPAWVTSNVIVDCNAQKIREELIQITPRGGALERAPDRPFRSFEDEADVKIAAFACSTGAASEAARAAMRKESVGGLHYLGDLTIVDVEEQVWASLWRDGERPVGASVRSIQEQKRSLADIEARRKRALGEAAALADRVMGQEAAEQAHMEMAAAREKRESVSVRRSLEGWIGQSDTTLVASWGNPDSYEDRGELRLVYYRKGYEKEIHRPNAPNLSETFAFICDIRFEFRGGKLDDYYTGGGSCDEVIGR